MTPTVLIVGGKNSGKTTLAVKVIRELVSRGYKVGALKHSAHAGDLDTQGKDTARMREAGAVSVGLASNGITGFYKQSDEAAEPESLRDSWFEGVDVLIGEGFKGARLPKIAVVRRESGQAEGIERKGLLAVASDMEIDMGVPRFDINDAKGLADLVEKQIERKRGKRDVSLQVNGKRVFIKPFIKDFLLRTILGMVASLKGTENADSIVIRIQNAGALDMEEEE